MQLSLAHASKEIQGKLTITGSKSETNRLLLLQALYPELAIENKSNSDDSVAMEHALVSKENLKDIHHAGTAMRFLTAYFATKNESSIVLTGSQRMQERHQTLGGGSTILGADIIFERSRFSATQNCWKTARRRKCSTSSQCE